MKKISRRSFLTACAAVAGTAALTACGGSGDSSDSRFFRQTDQDVRYDVLQLVFWSDVLVLHHLISADSHRFRYL